MFPLAGKDFPTSSEELSNAIQDAISELFKLKKGSGVTVDGGEQFPHVKQIKIDLDGAKVSATEAPPKPLGVGKRKPGIAVDFGERQ